MYSFMHFLKGEYAVFVGNYYTWMEKNLAKDFPI